MAKMNEHHLLEEFEAVFKAFAEYSSEAFVLLDENLNCLSINPVGARLLSASEADLLGKNILDIIPDIKETGRYDGYLNVIKTGKPLQYDNIVPYPKFGDRRLSIRAFKVGTRLGLIVTDVTKLKKTEEKLQQSERSYRLLFDSTIDGMFVIDAATMKVVLTNEAGRRMGVFNAVDDVTGVNPLDFIHPEDREKVTRIIVEDIFEKDLQQVNEFRVVTRDGKELWLSALGRRIQYQGGLAGLVSIREVTERKHMEEALRRSEQYFRSVVEHALDGIVVLKSDGTISYGSPSIERMLGYTQDELTSSEGLRFAHPEDLPGALDIFVKLRQSAGAIVRTELRVRHKDGSWRVVEAVANSIAGEQGLEGIIINWRDVTERKRMELALQESEERYRAIVETSLDGIYQVDISGKFTLVNESFARTFGYEREELLGKHFSSMLSAETSATVAEMVKDVLAGENVQDEVYVQHKEGYEIPVSFSATPLKNRGEIVGLSGILMDFTKRRAMEEELRSSREQLRNLSSHLQRAREEERTFIAREIHDELGQTLTALKMDLSWLSNRLSPEQEPLLKKIRAMLELTDTAIHTVKTISAELRPGILDDLGLEDAIEWLTEEFQNRTGIECEFISSPRDITLDQGRTTTIFRILQEALTNIVRHAGATKVKVSLQQKADRLLLKVKDNGTGITKDLISSPTSFGLIGMQERARSWGGEVGISGVRGKGTTVLASIPINTKGDTK